MIELSNFKYEEPGVLLPIGDYNCIIRKVTQELPKTGGEEFAKIHYQIMDGEQNGKFITDNLFLFSEVNSDKYRIATEKLNWLRKVSGLVDASTLEQFIGVKLGVTVKHKDGYANVKRVFEIKADDFSMPAANTPFVDDDIPDMGASAVPF